MRYRCSYFQRPERTFPYPVLTWAAAAGANVRQLRAAGDELGKGVSFERATVVIDQLDRPDCTGGRIGQLLDQRHSASEAMRGAGALQAAKPCPGYIAARLSWLGGVLIRGI